MQIAQKRKTLTHLDWKTYSNEIKVADVDPELEIDQLFIDGSQQTLARYPNYDAGQALQGCTTQANIKKRSESWSNPKGGYIRALHNHKWGGNSYVITGKDASAREYLISGLVTTTEAQHYIQVISW